VEPARTPCNDGDATGLLPATPIQLLRVHHALLPGGMHSWICGRSSGPTALFPTPRTDARFHRASHSTWRQARSRLTIYY
jgi:hypothetical protein